MRICTMHGRVQCVGKSEIESLHKCPARKMHHGRQSAASAAAYQAPLRVQTSLRTTQHSTMCRKCGRLTMQIELCAVLPLSLTMVYVHRLLHWTTRHCFMILRGMRASSSWYWESLESSLATQGAHLTPHLNALRLRTFFVSRPCHQRCLLNPTN